VITFPLEKKDPRTIGSKPAPGILPTIGRQTGDPGNAECGGKGEAIEQQPAGPKENNSKADQPDAFPSWL